MIVRYFITRDLFINGRDCRERQRDRFLVLSR